jgi:hypothetical protein
VKRESPKERERESYEKRITTDARVQENEKKETDCIAANASGRRRRRDRRRRRKRIIGSVTSCYEQRAPFSQPRHSKSEHEPSLPQLLLSLAPAAQRAAGTSAPTSARRIRGQLQSDKIVCGREAYRRQSDVSTRRHGASENMKRKLNESVTNCASPDLYARTSKL